MVRDGRFALLAFLLATLASVPGLTEVRTSHFRFVPDSGSTGLADHLATMAEAKRSYVLGLLGVNDERVLEVRIASSEEDMERMVGTDRPVREWIAGLAYPQEALIVLSARGNEVFNASDTFVHELAHVYLESAVEGRYLPRWFQEGFAMLVAGEDVGERLKTFLGAAATGSFLPLDTLARAFPAEVPTVHLAYAQSQLFVRYLQRTGGGIGVKRLVESLRTGVPFDLAFERTFDGSPDDLWHRFARTVDPFASWLVFATSAALLWMLITALFLWAYARKRRKAAARKAMWAMREELERLRAVVDEPGAARIPAGDPLGNPLSALAGPPRDGPEEVQ